MKIGPRTDWTGHNFPSVSWVKGAGYSITWFRQIGSKRFMFTLWGKPDRKVGRRIQPAEFTYVQCMDVTSGNQKEWHTRHHFSI